MNSGTSESRYDDPLDATTSATPPPADDPRVLDAVQEYMAALEAGKRPNRQEFLSRHADIAEELSICLDGLAFVHSAAAQLHRAAPGETAHQPHDEIDLTAAQPLGDFRLMREIGRGGMGVVYEAMQLSLGRRVAVKVLPLAAALDSRHLQRFRNEAQAAAQLHHTNIVPVYAVGCERAVHYYAMQLIEGQSLAEVIRDLRRSAGRASAADRSRDSDGLSRTATWVPDRAALKLPSSAPSQSDFNVRGVTSARIPADNLSIQLTKKPNDFYRSVARLGLQAAEALDYAHRLGVVHRDIKPANLLLDLKGNLWITDFGLAQIYADGGLTQTGDLVGTLRYMSPEQASGRAVVLDQRTDIYSLGVTLYELLTLERALLGETREQLLNAIGTEDPKPARSIDPNIPPELETVLAKAAAKDPADRYQSALTFAEDLRRFLDDEPILARPPSMWDKAVKWTRRHKSLALSTMAMLTLAAIGLLTSTLLIANEQRKTREALERETTKSTEATQQRKLAEAKTHEADQQRERAEKSFRQAREVVDFYTRVAEQKMEGPGTNDVRRELLEASLVYYSNFINDRERAGDTASEKDLVTARARVASILDELVAVDELMRLGHRRMLLLSPDVLDDLQLTEEQRQQVVELNAKQGNPFEAISRVKDSAGQQPARDRLSQMADEDEAEWRRILTDAKWERLKQISRQEVGPQAFNDPDVEHALALTAEQKESIRTIQNESRGDFGRGGRPDDKLIGPGGPGGGPGGPPGRDGRRGERKRQAMEKILALLTDPQRQAWQRLAGEEFKGQYWPFGRGPGGPQRGGPR